ncbi:hypothetical protein SPBR_03999 [Sporothrix brasiliensis 5110]|uniref:Thioesterase domain-containing protein n=1 Tax=Sporothrix brasiliensis 5110 TaxID=1398154 RepID=A0A0C2J8C1_9PEZI|nr:uncharacterized protein SPBR_03999 [Sporothrix brasiliensis 5110]KIH95260.1 hypothetical protein SPBR_03999 [Sporothrix brasiliensis 5110]
MPQSQSIQDTVRHFSQQPWCAELFARPGNRCTMPSSRYDRENDTTGRLLSQDNLFHRALNNDDGVPHMLVVYQEYGAPGVPLPPAPPGDASLGTGQGLRFLIPSVSLLLDLRDNVRGFNGYTHGGFLGTIIDEVMGALIYTNYEVQATKEDEAEDAGTAWQPAPKVVDMSTCGLVMTAGMDVKFRKPVATPGVVISTATLNRIDGRKIYFDVEILDGTGAVCTTCEGLWISMTPLREAVAEESTSSKL